MQPLPPEFALFVATVAEIIALGTFVVVLAMILSYLLDKIVGELSLVIFLFITTCLAGYVVFGFVGWYFFKKAQGWATAGLVIAIIFVAGLAALIGKRLGSSESGKRRGAIFVPGLWIGFCFASWVGHRASTWVGMLTITVPTVMIFWLSLYFLARFILPLDEGQPVSTAFRCLSTFSAGTNYPYYVIEDREKIERVPGNQFKRSFAGPGIFLTGPDHVVTVSVGLEFRGVRGPGVVFTQYFESIQEPMDLRPQQRAYTVEAITKDGIHVKVNTFGCNSSHLPVRNLPHLCQILREFSQISRENCVARTILHQVLGKFLQIIKVNRTVGRLFV